MWNSIVSFLASIIDVFYDWTGNFGVAVIIFTIIVKGLLLPLDVKSRKSTARIQELNPEAKNIRMIPKNAAKKCRSFMQKTT